MKCRRCRGRAVVEVPRSNASFCGDCFTEHYVRNLVTRAIRHDRMFGPDERVLVAVSGGKDSLMLWDVLLRLGYDAAGLYVGLGIGGYSDRSGDVCRSFAEAHGARLHVVDLAAEEGFTIPEAAASGRRPACAVCGLSKRTLFNRVAREEGYDVLATGHNLDDEVAVLLGNVLRWETGYLARQSPVLEATHGSLVRKVKPLYRVMERETAAYCVIRGIDYVVEECPLVEGNTQMRYKGLLDQLEASSPGTKHNFLFGFLEKGRAHFPPDGVELRECVECGSATPSDVCAFCRARRAVTLPIAALR
ncbi:MAG TPA: ATP-binding protein [Mycobacteriales bacterium]|nr:ATP-binding protein [Mycobacteriales bacterium]